MSDELLTVQEVAAVLKLNQQTVRNMVDRGELAAVRVGSRRVRIRQSALDAFLEAGSQPGVIPEQPAPVAEVDEGSITAWAAFGASMVEATSTLERTDQHELVRALEALSDSARMLADQLRPEP